MNYYVDKSIGNEIQICKITQNRDDSKRRNSINIFIIPANILDDYDFMFDDFQQWCSGVYVCLLMMFCVDCIAFFGFGNGDDNTFY